MLPRSSSSARLSPESQRIRKSTCLTYNAHLGEVIWNSVQLLKSLLTAGVEDKEIRVRMGNSNLVR